MLLDISTDATNDLDSSSFDSATGVPSPPQQTLATQSSATRCGDENEPNDFFHPDCVARLNMIMNMVDSVEDF